MKRRMFVLVSPLVFIGVAMSNSPARAQSINIDYGDGAGTPSEVYAGAGSAGVWNALAGPSGTPEALVGLDGSPIPATVTLTGGAGGPPNLFDNPGTSGEDEQLLDDYTSGGTDATGSIFFSGLENGAYQVIVYAWTPGDPDVFTAVWEDCTDIISLLIGGTWPGQLEDGITQARFVKTVVDGTMQICTAGGLTWEGAINGVQLIALECPDGPGGICSLPADIGPCDGVCPRFYYNSCTKQCEPFEWGCCYGNANNFETVEACQSACPEASAQTTHYVDALNCVDPGSGEQGDPFCTIQDGIDAAQGGDTVLVASGTYVENIIIAGKSVVLRSTDGADVTTIKGDGQATLVSLYRGGGADSTVDGFTITEGGIGVIIYEGGVVSNCHIVGNGPKRSIGGIGMAVGGSGSASTITNCVFHDNGALIDQHSNLGGGVMVDFGTAPATFNSCTFSENRASGGAGMFIRSPFTPREVTLVDCRFVGNHAFAHGGGIYAQHIGVTTLINCEFIENTAVGQGAALAHQSGGRVDLFNCSMLHNSADFSVIQRYSDDGSGNFVNCTFAGNNAKYLIAAERDHAQVFSNSIMWGNSITDLAWVGEKYSAPAFEYSSVQGWDGTLGGAGNNGLDPLLRDLAAGDVRLSPGSPSIDAGTNFALPLSITTDLDGLPRLVDDPNVVDSGIGTAPIIDRGAYEFAPCLPCLPCLPSSPPTTDIHPKNRFLSIEAGDPDRLQAIRITFVDLPPPFAIWNGAQMWVGPTGLISDNGSVVAPIPGFPNFQAATLQCSPHYDVWSSLGTVNVFHEGIVPPGTYRIQVIGLTCDPVDESLYSDPLDMTTARWGDTVENLSTFPPGPPDGAVHIVDVLAVLRRFASTPGGISKPRADLEPGCVDLVVNITDALASVAGFQGLDYPFEPTAPDPCDSTCVNPLP